MPLQVKKVAYTKLLTPIQLRACQTKAFTKTMLKISINALFHNLNTPNSSM